MYKVTGGGILLDVNFILEKALVKANMTVADLGCGTLGHFVFPLARIVGDHGRVYAVDILHTALETVERRIKLDRIKNVETIWSNLEIFQATKIESGKLDIGLLLNTLYLSNKRAEIVRESIRMIKKGGRLIVVEWDGIDIPFGPPIEERVKKGLLISSALKLGLHLEEEFIAGQFHYGLIFIK